jgi:hypothetical protein
MQSGEDGQGLAVREATLDGQSALANGVHADGRLKVLTDAVPPSHPPQGLNFFYSVNKCTPNI